MSQCQAERQIPGGVEYCQLEALHPGEHLFVTEAGEGVRSELSTLRSQLAASHELVMRLTEKLEKATSALLSRNLRLETMADWLRCKYMHGAAPCMKCGFVGTDNLPDSKKEP